MEHAAVRRGGWRTLVAVAVAALLVGAVIPAAAQGESRRLAAVEDPVGAAIALSEETSSVPARQVVLGRSDVFADNLAGAALTQGNGPLLLVDPAPAPLADEVLAEIQRVLGTPQANDERCGNVPADVLVLGGVSAISEDVLDTLRDEGYCPSRLAGDERVGTSVAVASHMLAEFLEPGASRGTLLIATAGNPADSASASAWAAANGFPIVVTGQAALDPQVRDLLTPGDTAWEEVILLGGEAALSAEVEEQVIDAVSQQGFVTTVRRVAGVSRDDTAYLAATELWDTSAVFTAIIVNGFRPDFWTTALPAAAVGGLFGAPLLYVNPGGVPANDGIPETTTELFLREFPISTLLTVGPESEVPEATRTAAEGMLGSGVGPDDPDEEPAAPFLFLDDGVVYDGEGQALTPPGEEVTGFDVNADGDIAITVDGDLFCLCGGIGTDNLQVLHAPETAEQLSNPVFTPEGTHVVVTNTFEDAQDLQVVDLGGEDARFITTTGDADPILSDQQFSPHGGVVITALGGELATVHLDGSGAERLDLFGFGPAISPDGTTILFTDGDGTFTAPSGGGDTARLNDRVGEMAWLDDNVIIQVDAIAGELWAHDLRGADTQLTDDLPGMIYSLDVHPAEGQALVSNQSTVRLYDVASATEVVSLAGDDIQQVRFGAAAAGD
ncbi:cell wall-binding repeat-containing protein [Euzebya sp.]|uniref:cell wall-binding repeat-containing protein n=1 Tax=Euzebya sp. TaxID=1971409 RepID=UPI003514BB94